MAEKGITKRELASRLKILPQNVNITLQTENLSKLRQIADALGCDVEDFLTNPKATEINGYIEFNGAIYKIKSINDFNVLSRIINDGNKK